MRGGSWKLAPASGAVAVVALAALTVLQCRSTAADAPVRPDPASVDVRDAAPAVTVSPAPTGAIGDWADPRAIAALARSCTWTPPHREEDGEDGVLGCHGDLFEQSCVYDPCFEPSQSCKPRCAEACDGCASACDGTCTSCEAACHDDDDCRLACARATAACKTSCTSARDRCITAGCAGGYRACREKVKAAWLASSCAKVCKKVQACTRSCLRVDCSESCFARYRTDCPGDLAEMCVRGDVESLQSGGTP